MSDCFGKIKYTKKRIDFYNQVKNLIIDIDLNEKVKEIIENLYIPILMKFKFNKNRKIFELIAQQDISQDKIKDVLGKLENNNNRICVNINQFIKYFPNMVKLTSSKHLNILTEIENLSIPKKINDYLIYVQNMIKKNKIYDKDEFKIIDVKIFDFVMNKLYDKLFPNNPSEKDIKIYDNCVKLSWTESKHFINNDKAINYDIFMDDFKQFFTQLEKEKSPRKKYEIALNIFQTILKIQKFNGEDSKNSADDYIQILLYIFVRVQPKKIHTNIIYMNLFPYENDGAQDNIFIQLKTVCQILENFLYTYLINIDQKEYDKQCKLHKNEINNNINEDNK